MKQAKPDTSTTGKHQPALDGVRGLAVTAVLIYHLLPYNPHPAGGFLIRLGAMIVSSGWVGVDLFFALSGFLITGILFDTLGSSRFLLNFYARRALRIFPLYFGFIGIVMLLSLALGYQWHSSVLLYLTYTQNLVSRNIDATNTPWADLLPFWTLAVEEQFYLFWPLFVYLLRTRRRIVTAALCVACVSVALRIHLETSGISTGNPWRPYGWTPARLDTLLFGAVLAIGVRSHLRSRILAWSPVLAVMGVLVLSGYTILQGGFDFTTDPLVRTAGFSALGLTSCTLIAGVQRPGFAQALFRAAPLRFFGRYSYGLYVIHFSVLRAMERAVRPALTARLHSNAFAIAGTGAATFVVTLTLAVASFHFFEQPILALKRHFQDDSGTPKLDRILLQPASIDR